MPRALLALIALAAASPTVTAQPSAPLAQARGDLDGDGKSDEVRVTRAGILVFFAGGNSKRVDFKVVSGLHRASAVVSTVGGEGRVLVTGEDRDGAGEAVWLRVVGRRVSELWRGTVGVVDTDTGTRRRAEIIGGDLVVSFDNPAVTRCDGEPARLDSQNLVRGALVPFSPPLGIDSSAPTIAANSAAPSDSAAAARANFFNPGAASSAQGTMSPDLLVGSMVTLGDGDPRTEWVEARPGRGSGEFVSFRAKKPAPVTMLRIIPGTARSAADFKAHNRPRRIAVLFDSGDRFWAELGDEPMGTAQFIVLPQPIDARCVTLVLDSVYPDGNQRRDRGETALSEVAVLTTLDLAPGGVEAALVQLVVAGGADGRSARLKLERLGRRAAVEISGRLGRGDLDAATTLKLRRILAAIGAAPVELARGLGQRIATERDRDELGAALVKLGVRAVPALKALVADRKAARAGREHGARTLGAIGGPTATTALLELVEILDGRDAERLVRAALSRALGEMTVTALPAVIAAAARANGNARADLHSALGRIARRSDDSSAVAPATDALVAALDESGSYEQRYRLLVAIAGLRDPRAIAVASARLEDRSSRRATDVALRRVTTRALGRNPAPAAAQALILATRDGDVGVREAAVESLAQRIEIVASDEPLAGLLASDPWPSVRRGAAGALAARCDRSGPRDALRAAVRSENDVRVGQAVLTSVVRCGGDKLAELLVAVARSSKRPPALRAHAVTLLGQLGGAEVAATLIKLFDDFVRDSFSEAGAISLAQAAAGGLCRVGDRSAIKPLAAAAENSAYPEIQAAAASALGCYCDKSTAGLLRTLAASPKAGVSIAARRALERCRRR